MIWLLNGTSSSGKTTLAKAVQRALPGPALVLGIDTVVFALPGRYLDAPLWHEVYRYETSAGGDLRITAGPLGDRLVRALHRMVAAAAGEGWDVVVDHVIVDESWAADAVATLAPLGLTTVGVRCPLDVAQQRERDRRDRTLGQAKAHFDVVHRWLRYDVEVDTSIAGPDECAATVVGGAPTRR